MSMSKKFRALRCSTLITFFTLMCVPLCWPQAPRDRTVSVRDSKGNPLGSGLLVKSGQILTNYHVVEKRDEVLVVFV